ncbi:MAG: permease [Myxococcota bacterium]|nr:permease [Myxococcota bacterium]
MWLALAVSVGSVAAGTAVVLLGTRSRRWLEPVRTFALVAAGVVVLAQLLPAAMSQVGLWALLVFGIGLVAPAGFERLVRNRAQRPGQGPGTGRDASWVAVELGYIGLLAHKLADGMALGLFGGLGHSGVVEVGGLVAIAAHTVPITGVLVLAYADRYSVRQAILRAAGVATATVLGVLVVGATPADIMASGEPWILALASGLLLHVIGHDWRAEAPRDLPGRLADMAAIAAGIGLVLLAAGGAHEHGHGHGGTLGTDLRPEIFSALFELSLETAPVLLIGLVLAALLQTFGGRISGGWLQGGNSLRQAIRGAVVGAPLPICACGVLPLAESLRTRGAGPALVVAFLLATPELGVESFALTVRFLGWPFALVRLGAALAVAIVAALVLARFSPRPETGIHREEPVAPGSHRDGVARRVLDHFDELLHHVGPFTLVGLILAAYTQAALPAGAASGWSGSGLDIFIVSLVAVPSYVCAAAATPLAAVLIGKGFSSGAVLAGLLLGPATNLATVGFLRRAYGARAAWMGLLALIASVWAFSFGANALGLEAVLSQADLAAEHAHSPLSGLATAVLVAFLLRAIWRNGLRTWLATLGDMFGGGHDHTHSHDH